MDWQIVEKNWPAFLGRIEQRWPATDERDLMDIDGDRTRFVDYLAQTSDLTRVEANEEVEAWLIGEIPADVKMDERRDNANIRESGRHIPPGEDVYSEDGQFGDDDIGEPPLGRSG
jgi:hypothetical protein